MCWRQRMASYHLNVSEGSSEWIMCDDFGCFCNRAEYSRIFFLWRCGPTRAMASSFTRFLDHTQRRTTVGRTPLDEWSARRRDLYLTTHNNHNRQTSMPPGGIRTHNLSRRGAADWRLRPRGHWDRQDGGTVRVILNRLSANEPSWVENGIAGAGNTKTRGKPGRVIQCESEESAPANWTSRESLITVTHSEQEGVCLSICQCADSPSRLCRLFHRFCGFG